MVRCSDEEKGALNRLLIAKGDQRRDSQGKQTVCDGEFQTDQAILDRNYYDAESIENVAWVSEVEMSWEPVYRLVKKIPRGRVTTYGEVARALRLAGGARAVGYAMAATPSGRGIPWHRVLGAGGHIRVPERYEMIQRKLLQTEGVATDSTVIDLKKYGWSPARAKKAKKSLRAKPATKRR